MAEAVIGDDGTDDTLAAYVPTGAVLDGLSAEVVDIPAPSQRLPLHLTHCFPLVIARFRVVFISAYISSDVERHTRDRGVDYIVRKPFHVDSLIGTAQAALA